MTDPERRVIVSVDASDLPPDDAAERDPIPVSRVRGSRRVRAFARLAAVVDRVPGTEVPPEPPASDGAISVFGRPPEPNGSMARLREEALAALEQAQVDHDAAVDHAQHAWQRVHTLEEEVAKAREEEDAARRSYELIQESRRRTERKLRQARVDGEVANQRRLVTSRGLDAAKIRAERL
jgi:hypothetical protein